MTASLLCVNQLTITSAQTDSLVDNVSLTLDSGEWLALVGESGSGKSLTALSCLNLLPAGLNSSGQIVWRGENISTFPAQRLRQLRGGDIGMVYQEPLTALNPLHRIGKQLIEAITLHQAISPAQAKQRALTLLAEVGIDDAERRLQ